MPIDTSISSNAPEESTASSVNAEASVYDDGLTTSTITAVGPTPHFPLCLQTSTNGRVQRDAVYRRESHHQGKRSYRGERVFAGERRCGA